MRPKDPADQERVTRAREAVIETLRRWRRWQAADPPPPGRDLPLAAMENWTISKLWRRSRPLALLTTALVPLATAVLIVSLVLGHPRANQAGIMWLVAAW